MASAKKIPTIESKALSIAIKRAMVTRDMKVPALAKESGVPYGTLRKLLELNSVADHGQRIDSFVASEHGLLDGIVLDLGNRLLHER